MSHMIDIQSADGVPEVTHGDKGVCQKSLGDT